MNNIYQWIILGAGPAGIATVGLLLDNGARPESLLWIDPIFKSGDFGKHWSCVSSNTRVEQFLNFLLNIQSFDYFNHQHHFSLAQRDVRGFTPLSEVTKPLNWITDNLRKKINSVTGYVTQQYVAEGYWNTVCNGQIYHSKRIVLATGATPRIMEHPHIQPIELPIALNPEKLSLHVNKDDVIAVFGASHSAVMAMHHLVEIGVTKILNFYRRPLRYAIAMDGWTLYDNSGLKGETAKWASNNISKNLHPYIQRFHATTEALQNHLPAANKAVYAIGFQQRAPIITDVDPSSYDTSNGIIAPGLFGAGIGFPRQVIDPNGHREFNVGLWKFMNDIREALPIWSQYTL